MKKRILSFALVLCMILTLFPASVFAVDTVVASGTCGENLTWTLDDKGTLTISGTGDMMNYDDLHYVPWYSYCEGISNVVISEGVTSIGDYVFYNCYNLTSVDIPDSITSIGSRAFMYCSSLTSITIPDSVTSIGVLAFRNCDNLTSVDIPSSVSSIGEMAFYRCYNLADVYYSGSEEEWNAIKIYWGNDCLTNATIHFADIDTTIIASGNCGAEGDNLTWEFDSNGTLTISGTGDMYDYSKVANVPWYQLKESIKNLVIENGVTSIGDYAFCYCFAMNNVDIPESVQSIGEYAFYYCGIKSVTIPDSVTSIGDKAFNNCYNLTSITIPNSITSIGKDAFCDCESLTSVTIPNSVTTIGDSAFASCRSLASITIPDSVTSIGTFAFLYCTELTDVTIPSSVTNIGGGVFRGCSNLISVVFEGNAPESIGSDVFEECADGFTISAPANNATWTDSDAYDAENGTWNGYPIEFYENESEEWDRKVTIGGTDLNIWFSESGNTFCDCTSAHFLGTDDNGFGFNLGDIVTVKFLDQIINIPVVSDYSDVPPGNPLIKVSGKYVEFAINAGNFASTYGLADITKDANGVYQVSAKQGVTFPVDITFDLAENKGYVGYCAVDLNGDKVPGNRNMETNLGDLIADAMLWEAKRDIDITVEENNIVAVINGGSIRAWIHPGIINMQDLTTVLPFGNTVAVVYVTGADLLEALEASTYATPSQCGGFPQVAGIYYTIATYEEFDANEESYPGSTYYGPAGINRVTINSINGQDFNPEAIYAVVTNNFCAAGGDTYYAFSNAIDRAETDVTIDVAVANYIRDGLEFNVDQQYAAPQGRIHIKDAAPDTDIVASGTCGAEGDGTNLTWVLYKNGQLTISGTGDMMNYDSVQDIPWYGNHEKIMGVVIADGVTSIGDNAFRSYLNLKNVAIPDSVTSIGNSAFDCCWGLTSVTIPDSVISIGNRAFAMCSRLTSVAIPDGVTNISSSVFEECSSLTSVTIPDSVTSIGIDAFRLCSSLTSVIIPDSVTSIGMEAFLGCSSLTSITIPDSVTSIGNDAFANCSGITSIIIPDSVTNIGIEAFMDCNSLRSAVIPGSVAVIENWLFSGCKNLESVELCEGATTIAGFAFLDCEKLNCITIPASVNDIWDAAFYNCPNLTSALFMGNAPEMFGDRAFENCAEGFTIYAPANNATWTDSEAYDAEAGTWNGYPIEFISNHSYKATVTGPSCTEQGYTTYTCECGDSYVADYVEAIGHNFVNGKCTECGVTEPVAREGLIVVSDERARAGEEVTVSVSVEENPGIMVMILGFDYDKSKLELIDYEDGLMSGWKVASKAVWIGAEDVTANGVILKLKFKVLEDVEDGEVKVSVLFAEGDIANHDEQIIMPEKLDGGITVYTNIPGDINGDDIVNALDLVRLQRYITGEAVAVAASCDVNGDGLINAQDLVRLQRYLAGETVVIL